MRIHPLFITVLVTVGFAGVVVGHYRHRLIREQADIRKHIGDDTRELSTALRMASEGTHNDPWSEISSAVEHASDSFRGLKGTVSTGKGLIGAISRVTVQETAARYSVLQKVYVLFRTADQEAQVRTLFELATADIVNYNVDDDLRGLAPERNNREIIERMYRAKSGLLKSRELLRQARLSGKYPLLLSDVSSRITVLLGVIDTLIIDTNTKSFTEANAGLLRYRSEMTNLKAQIRSTSLALAETDIFASLADDADLLLLKLVEITQ